MFFAEVIAYNIFNLLSNRSVFPINIKKLHIEDGFLVKSTTYPSLIGEKYIFVIDDLKVTEFDR